MREFQTAGALTLKALADNVNDVHGTVSKSYSRLFCTLSYDQHVIVVIRYFRKR